MISGPFRGQRLNTLGGHMEVIKKRVNKFGTRSVKQISPKLLTLISPKMFTLISPRTKNVHVIFDMFQPFEIRNGASDQFVSVICPVIVLSDLNYIFIVQVIPDFIVLIDS